MKTVSQFVMVDGERKEIRVAAVRKSDKIKGTKAAAPPAKAATKVVEQAAEAEPSKSAK